MVRCILELALDGKAVKIPDLAIFSLSLNTKPADKLEKFSATKNVVGVRLHLRATGVFTRQQLRLIAQVKEQDWYSHDQTANEEGG